MDHTLSSTAAINNTSMNAGRRPSHKRNNSTASNDSFISDASTSSSTPTITVSEDSITSGMKSMSANLTNSGGMRRKSSLKSPSQHLTPHPNAMKTHSRRVSFSESKPAVFSAYSRDEYNRQAADECVLSYKDRVEFLVFRSAMLNEIATVAGSGSFFCLEEEENEGSASAAL